MLKQKNYSESSRGNKYINKRVILFFYINIVIALFCFFTIGSNKIQANTNEFKLESDVYQMSDNIAYDYSAENKVETMSFGERNIGQLNISGNLKETGKYRSVQSFESLGNITLSFDYDNKLKTSDKKEWNLISDTGNKVNSTNINASIKRGVLLIEKSYDMVLWENATTPLVDFFAPDDMDRSNIYTTSGEDLLKGTYYRITVAYRTGMKVGEKGSLWWKEDVFDYNKHAEIYEFFLKADASAYTLKNTSLNDEDFQLEDYDLSLLKKGETLRDGDTTTDGFTIDNGGASYLMQVSKDNGEFKNYLNKTTFNESGKYQIRSIGLDRVYQRTIYIFDGGIDKGFSTYFEESLVLGERIYAPESDYPVYSRGSKLHIKQTNESIPILNGKILNITTNEEVLINNVNRKELTLGLELGHYNVELYSGNNDSGSFYKYSFKFEIRDEISKPQVNYQKLMNISNSTSYNTKHLEVAYQTTQGGYIFVVFGLEQYDEAFSYAYEIEKRFIEKTTDGLYYKSRNNPNLKVKYFDYLELIAVLNEYAKQNVEINYFNPLDVFTYRTYNNDLLDELEKMNLSESINVFPNQETKDGLLSNKRYLNGFKFINIGSFESHKVVAISEVTGLSYDIEYNVDVSRQLSVSSKYTIIETNIYGNQTIYEAFYINENETISEWEITMNGSTHVQQINKLTIMNGIINIEADNINLKYISNLYDENSIFTIKAPNVYSFEIKGLISELKDITLYKKGVYEITFIDRVGFSYKLILNITGESKYLDVINASEGKISYTDLHNKIYNRTLDTSEEIIHTREDLINLTSLEFNANNYTLESYSTYLHYLNTAKEILNSSNSTQNEINNVTQKLSNAIENLVESTDQNEIFRYSAILDSMESDEYTIDSYSNFKRNVEEGLELIANINSTSIQIALKTSEINISFMNLLKRGNLNDLKDLLLVVKRLDIDGYTTQSVENLNLAFIDGYSLLTNENASEKMVHEAMTTLRNGINNLVRRANTFNLYELMTQIQLLDKSNYTKVTIERLHKDYNDAIIIYANSNVSQSKVDEIYIDLLDSFDNLVLYGNKNELLEIMETISILEPMLYSKESISDLKNEYDRALIILSEGDSQNKYDQQVIKLNDAYENLVKNEMKEKLYNELLKVSLDESNLHNSKEFDVILKSAIEVFNNEDATDEEIQEAIDDINDFEPKEEKTFFQRFKVVIFIIIGVIVLFVLFAIFI